MRTYSGGPEAPAAASYRVEPPLLTRPKAKSNLKSKSVGFGILVWMATAALVAGTASAQRYEAVFDRQVDLTESELSNKYGPIRNRIIGLIDAADAGSTIKIAMFFAESFYEDNIPRDPLYAALRRAVRDRNIHLTYVTESSNDHPNAAPFTEQLRVLNKAVGSGEVDKGPKPFVRVCNHSCDSSSGGLMHNKLWYFSSVGGYPVTVVSSLNHSKAQRAKHQQAIIATNDVGLANTASRLVDHLAFGAERPPHWESAKSSLYAMPRKTNIPAIKLGEVYPDSNCEIRVAMASWDPELPWGVNVSSRLTDLRARGCKVHVIVDDEAAQRSISGVPVFKRDGMHSKYMLIKARFAEGGPVKRIVLQGSHNYTEGSLTRSDNTLMILDDQTVFEDFWEDWEDILCGSVCPVIFGVNYNAVGSDSENPNGEYVDLANPVDFVTKQHIQMQGFVLRDAAGHEYTYGSYLLAPGYTIRVRSGDAFGTNIWNNDGDTAILLYEGIEIDRFSW